MKLNYLILLIICTSTIPFTSPKKKDEAAQEPRVDEIEYVLRRYKLGHPTQEHLKLVETIQKKLNIPEEIYVGKVHNEKDLIVAPLSHDKYLITVWQTEDKPKLVFEIYHEFGHVAHGDYQESLVPFESTPVELLKDPLFKRDIERIRHYTEVGKKAFTNSTSVGKKVNKVLSTTTTFWLPPTNPRTYDKVLFRKGQDERADLFALDNLYKEQNIKPIMQQIEDWALSSDIVTDGDKTARPSNFERALYLAGFLTSKGININQLLTA